MFLNEILVKIFVSVENNAFTPGIFYEMWYWNLVIRTFASRIFTKQV